MPSSTPLAPSIHAQGALSLSFFLSFFWPASGWWRSCGQGGPCCESTQSLVVDGMCMEHMRQGWGPTPHCVCAMQQVVLALRAAPLHHRPDRQGSLQLLVVVQRSLVCSSIRRSLCIIDEFGQAGMHLLLVVQRSNFSLIHSQVPLHYRRVWKRHGPCRRAGAAGRHAAPLCWPALPSASRAVHAFQVRDLVAHVLAGDAGV